MERTKTFQDLVVWQKAHSFVLAVYKTTEQFPKHEIYGLTSQFRRAAVSIAANIVEGYKKKDYRNKLNFLNIAHSSLEECRYYLILVKDLHYPLEENLTEQIEEVSRLLTGVCQVHFSQQCKPEDYFFANLNPESSFLPPVYCFPLYLSLKLSKQHV